MRRNFFAKIALFTVCCAVLAGGCGPAGPETHPVTGSVTLDGQPLPDGDIIFVDPTSATVPGAGKITNGKYTAVSPPGNKKVEIRASKMMPLPEGKTGAMGEKEMSQQYIPAKYNTETELTMEVTAGDNNKDFELNTK